MTYIFTTPKQAFLEVLQVIFFFFFQVIDNPFYKNSPTLLFIHPKVSGFSWCFKDSNEVLPSFVLW